MLPISRIENFCWRVEQTLVREGGFALISGELTLPQLEPWRGYIYDRRKQIKGVKKVSVGKLKNTYPLF